MNEEGSEIIEAESSLEAHTQDKTETKKMHPLSHNFTRLLSLFNFFFNKKRRLESKKQEKIKVEYCQPTYSFHA